MEAKATGTNQEDDDIMANDNDFAQENQAALIAATALPVSALLDVLDFVYQDEISPGRYLVAGVEIETIDCPDSLDAGTPPQFVGQRLSIAGTDAGTTIEFNGCIDYPEGLDAIEFNGHRVSVRALGAFCRYAEDRLGS